MDVTDALTAELYGKCAIASYKVRIQANTDSLRDIWKCGCGHVDGMNVFVIQSSNVVGTRRTGRNQHGIARSIRIHVVDVRVIGDTTGIGYAMSIEVPKPSGNESG
jgi:hypothetical protein